MAPPHSSPHVTEVSGRAELRPQIVNTSDTEVADKIRSREFESSEKVVRDPGLKAGAIQARLLVSTREMLPGGSFQATFEISCILGGPATLELLDGPAPIEPGVGSAGFGPLSGGEQFEPRCLKLDPFKTYRLSLVLRSAGAAKIVLAPKMAVNDESGRGLTNMILPSETQVIQVTPIMEFLARAFAVDYLQRRLSFEQSGWRGLMHIVNGLKVPKSHAYGEARYGRTFGRPLETLIKAGTVEYRTFRGKGRGGNVVRVRACYERESVKRLVNRLADNSPSPQSETLASSPHGAEKLQGHLPDSEK